MITELQETYTLQGACKLGACVGGFDSMTLTILEQSALFREKQKFSDLEQKIICIVLHSVLMCTFAI